MDFDLDEDQQAILEAVSALLEQHAGPARAVALEADGQAYDMALDAALAEAGFAGVAREAGPLAAALVTESVAHAAGVVAIAAGAMVAPAICDADLPGPVALTSAAHRGPVRFAAHARTLIVLDRSAGRADGGEARVVALEEGECVPVASSFGYPVGRLPSSVLERGEVLGAGSGERLERWWRLAVAVEAVGTMSAALEQTVDYLKERRQFGRAIGSFQGVQHRLAECAIGVEGSRWLVREAAYRGAPCEAAATAAAYTLATARRVFADTHQLSGAIGFTREHDLHVWSMRLQALRLELEGVAGHRRAVAEARWGRVPEAALSP